MSHPDIVVVRGLQNLPPSNLEMVTCQLTPTQTTWLCAEVSPPCQPNSTREVAWTLISALVFVSLREYLKNAGLEKVLCTSKLHSSWSFHFGTAFPRALLYHEFCFVFVCRWL